MCFRFGMSAPDPYVRVRVQDVTYRNQAIKVKMSHWVGAFPAGPDAPPAGGAASWAVGCGAKNVDGSANPRVP